MSSSIGKSLEKSNVPKSVQQGKDTTGNPCSNCQHGCTCGKSCNCGSDCTCDMCPGQQTAAAVGDKGGAANAPGAGETRDGQISSVPT